LRSCTPGGGARAPAFSPAMAFRGVALALSAAVGVAAAVPEHSVSGVSSGADMAVNHFVAFSSSVTGAGIVAGAPYGCNLVEGSDDKCGSAPPDTDWTKILPRLAERLLERAKDGLIDPLRHLWRKRLYLFSGAKDWVVERNVMEAVRRQFGSLVGDDGSHPGGAVAVDYAVNATHGWIVDGATCGPGEPGSSTSWCAPCCCSPSSLLMCEGHDLSGFLLRHLLQGRMGVQRSVADAPLIEVPQAPYVAQGRTLNDSGLWRAAYVYAPLKCRSRKMWCNVHVHYHGCVWGAEYTGTDLLLRLGLVEWGEAADMVFVFPQASSTLDSAGCWDWTGQSGDLFDTKYGAQLFAVGAMLEDLPRILWQAGQNDSSLIV